MILGGLPTTMEILHARLGHTARSVCVAVCSDGEEAELDGRASPSTLGWRAHSDPLCRALDDALK